MATWEDVVCKAKELADAAGRKVVDVADLTKQKLKIAENERGIRDAMEALGQIYYDYCKGEGLSDELVQALIAQIDEYMVANERLQAEIDLRNGQRTCSCGAVNPVHASYCNICGSALK